MEHLKMKFSSQIKTISNFKANAPEIMTELSENREPVIITQNGEAKAVLQDVYSYEQTQETLALLKMIAMSEKDFEEGRVTPAHEALNEIKNRVRTQTKK
jgi:prevent-host-death family protein